MGKQAQNHSAKPELDVTSMYSQGPGFYPSHHAEPHYKSHPLQAMEKPLENLPMSLALQEHEGGLQLQAQSGQFNEALPQKIKNALEIYSVGGPQYLKNKKKIFFFLVGGMCVCGSSKPVTTVYLEPQLTSVMFAPGLLVLGNT